MVQTKVKKVFGGVLAFAFWIAVWHFAAMKIGREVVLPLPLTVLSRFIDLARTASFWRATALSLVRIMSGYAAGVFCGILLGAAVYFVKPVRVLFSPLLTVVKSTPVASFSLLALVMLNDSIIPSVITFLMVLPMLANAVSSALDTTDKSLLEMAKVYRFSRLQTLRNIYFPTVWATLRGQVLTALGFAWKAGVAAEVICYPQNSIGRYLHDARVYLETTDLFAYTLLIILISLGLEKLLRRLLKGGAR